MLRAPKLIMSILKADDMRRYEIHWRQRYVLYVHHDVRVSKYPAIYSHLKSFRKGLEARANNQEWYELQQPQAAYVNFFKTTKIVFPDIGKETRFTMDTRGHYVEATGFLIPLEDWYLLALLNSSCVWWYLSQIVAEIRGGYMRFKSQYLKTLPVPDVPSDERETIAKLAKRTQALHTDRCKRVEEFTRIVGIEPAESSSRNPLEQPWKLTADDFTRRARNQPLKEFTDARDETYALTEQITKIEREIDERVASLYGVPLEASEKKN